MDVTIRNFARSTSGLTVLEVLLEHLPAEPADVLRHVAGQVDVVDDETAIATWTWQPGMCPVDPRAATRRHLDDAIARWAAGWVAGSTPGGVQLAEPGDPL